MRAIYICIMLVFSTTVMSKTIKLATLVPEGTNWANTLEDMCDEVKKETGIKVKIFYGGIQGDEPDVLRKTRIGQLHGGVFTGKTLGNINFDTRIIEAPFNFYHEEQKVSSLINKISSNLNQSFTKQGFENLGFYEIGNVYVVSTKEVSTLKQMKNIKMWAWEGDKLIEAMMNSIGLVSVPLALPDVLSSLSTGIIDGAYAPPLGILALQWQNEIKYLIDFPSAYSIGALLISNKTWTKIEVNHQAIIKKIAQKYIHKANNLAKEDNKSALEQLKKTGVKFVSFSKEDLALAENIRKDVLSKLGGKFSPFVLGKLKEVR